MAKRKLYPVEKRLLESELNRLKEVLDFEIERFVNIAGDIHSQIKDIKRILEEGIEDD